MTHKIQIGSLWNKHTGESFGKAFIVLKDEGCYLDFPGKHDDLHLSISTSRLAVLVRALIAEEIVMLTGSE